MFSHVSGVSLLLYSVIENRLVAFFAALLLLAYSALVHASYFAMRKVVDDMKKIGSLTIIRKSIIEEFTEKGYFKNPYEVK